MPGHHLSGRGGGCRRARGAHRALLCFPAETSPGQRQRRSPLSLGPLARGGRENAQRRLARTPEVGPGPGEGGQPGGAGPVLPLHPGFRLDVRGKGDFLPFPPGSCTLCRTKVAPRGNLCPVHAGDRARGAAASWGSAIHLPPHRLSHPSPYSMRRFTRRRQHFQASNATKRLSP